MAKMTGPGFASSERRSIDSVSAPDAFMPEAYTEGDQAADTAADQTGLYGRLGRPAEPAGPDHGAGANTDVGQRDNPGGNVSRRVHSASDASGIIASLTGRVR